MTAVAVYVLTVLTVTAGLLGHPASQPRQTRSAPAWRPRRASRDSRATGTPQRPSWARTEPVECGDGRQRPPKRS